jgi:hypothetical protein
MVTLEGSGEIAEEEKFSTLLPIYSSPTQRTISGSEKPSSPNLSPSG